MVAFKAAFPNIPGLPLPATNLRPPRLDLGPRFPTERIADIVPPLAGRPFETLVPRSSPDGLDQGGINFRKYWCRLALTRASTPAPRRQLTCWATGRWDGSFVTPRTEAERRLFADPRPSLKARYTNRTDYESKLRAAAVEVVHDGFLREDEVDALVSEAGELVLTGSWLTIHETKAEATYSGDSWRGLPRPREHNEAIAIGHTDGGQCRRIHRLIGAMMPFTDRI